MRRLIVPVLLLLAAVSSRAQDFDTYFSGETLRLDYVFCGNATHQAIYFIEAQRTSEWAGRRNNLARPLLIGNGSVKMLDYQSGDIIYGNSFSTLFQEWQSYEEASLVSKAFENCIQVPFPKRKVIIVVELFDVHGSVSSAISHTIDPEDILIRNAGRGVNEFRAVGQVAKDLSKAVDVVIVSDGYTAAERDKFFADAARSRAALLAHEPFKGNANRFSFRAVFVPSVDSGPSIPHNSVWHDTALKSHFDTFYTERYLTTSSMRRVYDAIGTVPFEHVIVLVNTPVYGGGGIYNSVTIMGSDHYTFNEVLVHEFGHAFGGLGDEYFYDDMYSSMYPADTEPWEPNLTTLVDFNSKWADMLPAGTPVPTPVDELEKQDVRPIWHLLSPQQKAELNLKVGVYEGGGYQSHGVYRPVQECRMKINECEEFCPVCSRAIVRMINYYTQ